MARLRTLRIVRRLIAVATGAATGSLTSEDGSRSTGRRKASLLRGFEAASLSGGARETLSHGLVKKNTNTGIPRRPQGVRGPS